MLKKIIFNWYGDKYIVNVIKDKLTIVYKNKKIKKIGIDDLYYEDGYIGFIDAKGLIYNIDDVELLYIHKKA